MCAPQARSKTQSHCGYRSNTLYRVALSEAGIEVRRCNKVLSNDMSREAGTVIPQPVTKQLSSSPLPCRLFVRRYVPTDTGLHGLVAKHVDR